MSRGTADMSKKNRSWRMARWRPVCPECAYNLRGLTGDCCPECGVALPTTSRCFRRWAVQRLAWDRLRRTGLIVSYVRTVATLFARPELAGRKLVLPDRWGRAVRWCVVHLALLSLTAALLSNHQAFARWFLDWARPSPFQPPYMQIWGETPGDRIFVWLAQSCAAWFIVLTAIPAIGALLSVGIPGRHRAAKLAGIKWSLYLTPILWGPLIVWFGCYFLWPLRADTGMPGSGSPLPPPDIPAWLLPAVYGAWWALGIVANPYHRIRRVRVLLLYMLLFVGAWMLAARVLFSPGALRSLL